MRTNLAIATVMAIGAGVAGVGALDAVPNMVGGDPLTDLTLAVLNNCTALHNLGDPIRWDGAGSSLAENAMKVIGASATQLIGPMTRAMSAGICTGPTLFQRAGAEGLVVALQATAILANASTAGAEGIDYPGTAGNTSNQWRTVLRLIYTGMDISAGSNVFMRDCNSQARKDIVNNWDNVFHGTATSCTDSHPSIPGTGAGGYDQSNAIVEPGIRHAFRREDASGITDVFLAQLSLGGISYAQAGPIGSNAVQTAVYRALSGSPFCNNKRPDDDWAPVTLPGLNPSQIPEMTNVGVPAAAGSGLGFATQLRGSANAKNMSPYLTEYTDQDPIRRKCVGRGNNANVGLPFEQVCGADGMLGVVLPIIVPADLTSAERYPSLPCEPGKGFFWGPSLTRPTGDPMRCPNGDATQDFQCLLPIRTDLTQPNGIAFDCINPPGNVPQAVFDEDGNGSQFPDAPGTDGRTDVDGRVYNLILRKPNGEIQTVSRPDPSKLGTFHTPVAAAYYRIHTTRSLLAPPNHTQNTCGSQDNSDEQMNCLVGASPCSLGFGTGRTLFGSKPFVALPLNGIPFSTETVQNLVLDGQRYPMARKLYVNSLQGFEILHDSSSLIPGTDAEEELLKCFATLPFNGTINLQSPSLNLLNLPPSAGGTIKPLCEDFNGGSVCSDSTNADACLGNELISGGVIPTSSCDNGLIDGDEIAQDQCPAVRPTCNHNTHHCE